MRSNRGFTVIELILTVSMVAVLVAVAMPALKRSTARHNAKGAGMGLASDMMYARQLALTENNTFHVCFDVANNRYTIIDDNSSDGVDGPDCVTAVDDDSIVQTVNLLNSVTFGYSAGAEGPPEAPVDLASDVNAGDGVGFAGNIAQFNPNGTTNSGYVYVNNQDPYNDTYAVGIPGSATGNILTWRLEPETSNNWSR